MREVLFILIAAIAAVGVGLCATTTTQAEDQQGIQDHRIIQGIPCPMLARLGSPGYHGQPGEAPLSTLDP